MLIALLSILFQDGAYSSNLTIKLNLNEPFSTPTIGLPAFITELETTSVFEASSTIKPFVNNFTPTISFEAGRIDTTSMTDVFNNLDINGTEIPADRSETSVHWSETITTPDVTRSTLHEHFFGIEFIPSKSKIEIVENWPVSFPLPFKPRLSVKYVKISNKMC